jgi:outer membrane protein, heavy metal efflux system
MRLPIPSIAATITIASTASAASARPISFAEARDFAERLSPDVVIVARRADVAKADIHVAGTLANPTLTLITSRQSTLFSPGLSVPLPLFGQRSTAIDAASADAQVAALDAVVTREESRWNATEAWIDLWLAQERSKLLITAANEAERLLGITQERFNAGSAPRVDVVRATADRARASSEASFSRTAILSAAARLLPWIGESPESEVEAQGEPDYPTEMPAFAAVSQAALQHHPELQRDREGIQAAELHVRAEERQRWPVINGQLTADFLDRGLPNPGFENQFANQFDLIGGIAFDLPILNLRGGAIERAEAQRTVAEATVSADEARILAALRDAYQHTQGAAEQVRSLRQEVLPAMEEARRMTEEGYRAGRVDLLRLLEAQRALLETHLAVADAIASWSRAYADLERAAGQPLGAKEPHGH